LVLEKIRIGLIGLGHLGKIHLRCLLELTDLFEVVGVHDANKKMGTEVAEAFGVKHYQNVKELITDSEAIDLVTSTISHYDLGKLVLQNHKHLFVEKPICSTLQQAKRLTSLAKENNCMGQVGHVERYNPAVLALRQQVLNPMFIEVHRLASFNPRGTDVSVILDLMIHDLDLVLHWVKSPLKSIYASGVSVISSTPDIANVRLEFKNGCVANLTASRISMKQMRKVRLFQPSAYISIDLLEKKSEIIRIHNEDVNLPEEAIATQLQAADGRTRVLEFFSPEIEPVNAIKAELADFSESIKLQQAPLVSFESATSTLEVAMKILNQIKKNNVLQQETLDLG
jgi:predicted dehydrogenase